MVCNPLFNNSKVTKEVCQMPKTAISQDERQLIKLVEKMHLPEEDKNAWAERLRNGDMSEELASEIRQKLSEPQEGDANDEQHTAVRTRHLTELTMLVKRWRLTHQSHNFGKK
jgi:hypothetical protein